MKAIKLFLALLVVASVAIVGCDSGGDSKHEVNLVNPIDEKVFVETVDGTGGVSITFSWETKNIKEGFIPKICFDKGSNPYDGSVEFCEILEKNATSYTHFFKKWLVAG